MHFEIKKTEQSSRWLEQASWLVLLLGCILSLSVWGLAGHRLQAEEDARFHRAATEIHNQLEQQMDHYLDVLGGFQVMFQVSDQVEREVFHRHFLSLDAPHEYPALLAVQYAPVVHESDRAALEAAVRADRSVDPAGYPHFQITPPGTRAAYLPVVFNEPMAGNEPVFGFDLMTRALMQEVLAEARDSGEARLSRPVSLIQQDAPGLVLRLPLYHRHRPRDTVEQRRAAFRGLVCGVFRTVDLMKAVRPSADWAQLRWTVADLGAPGTSGTPLPLFDSAQHVPPAFAVDQAPADDDVRHSELTVAGRRWALSVSRAPLTPLLDAYPLALLLVGLTTTLGLWATLRSATARQAHAAAWAQRLSERAISSEHRLRAVLDNTIDGILVISREGHILDANQAVCRIFGEAQAQIIDQHLSRLIPAVKPDADRHAVETFLQLQQVGLDGLGRRTEGRRAPGMTFPLDLAVSQMEWEGETQYIAVVRDLSAQEAADRAILEAQRQLNEVDEMRRVIVHNAPYAIFVLNPHGVIQAVNPAGERLLGYKAHELIGRSTTQ
ncbi:MAG TPA: CHASE domain-containing protein, partial [Aquabacterium sp.]|nr:CHASE domain-containing protein [Aquabacterium sp.]